MFWVNHLTAGLHFQNATACEYIVSAPGYGYVIVPPSGYIYIDGEFPMLKISYWLGFENGYPVDSEFVEIGTITSLVSCIGSSAAFVEPLSRFSMYLLQLYTTRGIYRKKFVKW